MNAELVCYYDDGVIVGPILCAAHDVCVEGVAA